MWHGVVAASRLVTVLLAVIMNLLAITCKDSFPILATPFATAVQELNKLLFDVKDEPYDSISEFKQSPFEDFIDAILGVGNCDVSGALERSS